ncbi:MAG: hypothetical protein IPO81_12550 [Kouleothrix sp.]|nr:hypothetical protein [Kouleothrix sp.]
MFHALIEQARSMIQRLYASADQGRDTIAESVKVRYSELEAWDSATRGIVATLFGADAVESVRWHALAERRSTMVGEAMRKDIKRGEYIGLVDYFHVAVGLLLELDATYQHRLAAATLSASRAAAAPAAPPEPPRDYERLEQRAAQERPDDHRRASPVDDGRWDLTITLSDVTYQWLCDAAAAREPARVGDDAAAQLAATIVERVSSNTRSRAG